QAWLKQAAKNEICPLIKALTQIPQADSIRLFLCGDVMTGRGIDQVLPHPNDPRLHEPYIGEARSYVELAESVNGAIQRPGEIKNIWGDALRNSIVRGWICASSISRRASLPARTTGAPLPHASAQHRLHHR